MPRFRYKGRSKESHKLVSGSLEATNHAQAVKELRTKGILILDVTPDRSIHLSFSLLNRVSAKDRVLFARQFAVMMRAGLPIIPALRAIEDQTANKTLKKTLRGLTHDIDGGTTLSEAFAKYPNVFPPIFISVTKIGEKSGKLEDVLEKLAVQLEKDGELTSKVRGAMIYPAFVMVALVVVMILIMVYIVPQLKGLFDDVGMDLPLVTRMILALSSAMQRYLVVIVALLAGLGIGVRVLSRRSEKVRLLLEQIRLRLPVFGRLYRQMIMARFSHTLATLLGAGLPMLDGIKTTASSLNSPTFGGALTKMAVTVENGQPLSQSLLAEKEFSPMIGHMVAIGEKSGNIDEMLETVGGFFDQEIEVLTRNLSALLEPMLMLMMGLGVGLVIASVISPIYGLVNAV